MSEVIPFKAKERTDADGPHCEGQAFCGACGHEWVAVAPIGVVHLDCPECGRRWGLFKNAVEPSVAWKCKCGEALFFLTPVGAMCRHCGIVSNDWGN